jgi:hypothetical protein
VRVNFQRPIRIHKGAWFFLSALLFVSGLFIRFPGDWEDLTIGSLWVVPFHNPEPVIWVIGLSIAALYSAAVLLAAVFVAWILQYFMGLGIESLARRQK